ncbi:MAG: heparinase II/III family protein, partial [Clostridia bacterium]|nr:heparinase II/III family protein [Clostridia bacterium]
MCIKMNRRLFEERKTDVTGKVLSLADYRPFFDSPEGFTIQPGHYANLIKVAEDALAKDIPMCIATDYMMFRRNGNRTIYESKMFARRINLLQLAIGEYVEKKGRFMDRIVDLIWLILEETTWVIPASNPDKIRGIEDPLPYAYKDDPDFIDLFTAGTGGTMSWVYHLLKDELDKITPVISERMEYELERRMIRPFMSPAAEARCWWMGIKGNKTNNWNPWIISNVLTVCSLVEKDTEVREKLVARAISMLNNFTAVYYDDGGCDEGPGYWGAAGAAFFECLQLIYDMTGGYVNLFDDSLVRKMGEYEVKACINGNRFLNFADCPARVYPDPAILLRWGRLCNSEMMLTYAQSKLRGKLPSHAVDWTKANMYMRRIVEPACEEREFVAPTKFYFDGLAIAGTRESSVTDKGFFLAIKGGCNAESHNHNDIGNVIVFADGKPILIDAGSGVYTRRTFSSERYTIWAMRSEYHNCATVNGVDQLPG